MLRLRHGMVVAGVERRPQAEAAGQLRRLVGQDVPEHVGGDDDVELSRVADQVRRGRIDQHLRVCDVRMRLGCTARLGQEDAVGQTHHVRLVHRDHAPAAAAGKLEGDPRDPRRRPGRDLAHGDPDARHGEELGRARRHVAVGIEAFGILAHDDQVHLRCHGRQRGVGAGRADIGVEVERRAQGPGRVDPAVGARRVVVVADRAEQHRADAARRLHDPVRTGCARLLQRGKADIGLVQVEREAERLGGAAQHPGGGGGDLGADAVARQDDEGYRTHGYRIIRSGGTGSGRQRDLILETFARMPFPGSAGRPTPSPTPPPPRRERGQLSARQR